MSKTDVNLRWKISSSLRDPDIIIGPPTFERIEVMPVTEHESIVAELKAENDILKSKASQFESTLKETIRVRDAEIEKLKRVVKKLKRYTQHRVDCICRAGVLQYSEDCDCGLKAIEQGEGT